jgi:cytochrome oxidase Cu insertion factor (SCO1/SenC/PrrC family)
MLTLVYGSKGSGKTKRIIDLANTSAETVNPGEDVIFVTDTDRYMLDINNKIRKINITLQGIKTADGLEGFVRGLIEGNHDISYIYIDGIHRILNKEIDKLKKVYDKLSAASDESGFKLVVTVNKDEADLPKFLKKYLKNA